MSGSSPRVRGSPPEFIQHTSSIWIIPAGAGLTVRIITMYSLDWDHPRGCGAHMGTSFCRPWRMGSSPRVRGSLVDLVTHGLRDGIIPAGAGLTQSDHTRQSANRDHPRGCGAHDQSVERGWQGVGSSPRVRGSPSHSIFNHPFCGIIPAGAGLTHVQRRLSRLPWDHPRGCGAHASGTRCRSMSGGSSPRVRGSR